MHTERVHEFTLRRATMRKIEQQMIQAIKENRNWKSGNTSVCYSADYGTSRVYLHDNLIAIVSDTDVEVFDGGWRSVTTKSRLNSLINDLCDGRMFGVFQRKHQWYINDGVVTVDFEHGYNFPRI